MFESSKNLFWVTAFNLNRKKKLSKTTKPNNSMNYFLHKCFKMENRLDLVLQFAVKKRENYTSSNESKLFSFENNFKSLNLGTLAFVVEQF